VGDKTSVKFTDICVINMLNTLHTLRDSMSTLIYLLRFLVAFDIKLSYFTIADLYAKGYIRNCTKQSLEIILDHAYITSDAIDQCVMSGASEYNKYYINSMAAKIINYTIPLHIIARGIILPSFDDKILYNLAELFLCNSNIVLTQEIMDMSVRYNNRILYRKCVEFGLKYKIDHIKYAILYDNTELLELLIDNKFIPTGDDMKYNISCSDKVINIVNTSLFEKYLAVKTGTAVKSMSSYVRTKFGLFEDVADINFDMNAFALLMYAMKFPEEFVNIPVRTILCIESITIRLLLFDIIDEFKNKSTDKIIINKTPGKTIKKSTNNKIVIKKNK
jgi:hypothetical protein